MVKPLTFPPHRFPVTFSSLEQTERAHYVSLSEGERILDRAIHVTLGRQMNDSIHMLLLHQLEYSVKITDIHFDKSIIRLILNILKVIKIARVC